jgi:hypothetical protein
VSRTPPNESLRDLAALLGDEATREIVRMFLQNFPESMALLARCGRMEQMRIAHGLKSSALHMGAPGLSERMRAMEEKLAHPGESISPEELGLATADFEAFAAGLREYAGA